MNNINIWDENTDLIIKMVSEEAFELNILFLADDGYIYKAHIKRFIGLFKANDLDNYTKDWATWRLATTHELKEIRERNTNIKYSRRPNKL